MDVDLIKTLVSLMNENELSELEVEEGGFKLRLRKRGKEVIEREVVAVPTTIAAPLPMVVAAAGVGAAGAAAAASVDDPNLTEVRSPLVGTFYRARSPEDANFVEVGDSVSEDTILGLVEAMKVFNEIKAECEGVIKEILIDNGEAVEYGQPLCRIRLEGQG